MQVRAQTASSKGTVSLVSAWFRADSGTNLIKQGEIVTGRPCGSVAQLSECSHGMQAVLGSIPGLAMCCFLHCDTRLILFYKIVYNLVAVSLPQQINHPVRMTRHMHLLHFVQIPATASYYKYSFFPLAIVQWNRLPISIISLSSQT